MSRGQLSVCAAAEILLSTALVWLWASYTPFPFWTWVATLAVPLLLLRSPQSVQRGKALLKIYLTRENIPVGVGAASALVAVLAGWACYELICHWLPSSWSWDQWWRIAIVALVVYSVVLYVAYAVAVAVAFAAARAVARAAADAHSGLISRRFPTEAAFTARVVRTVLNTSIAVALGVFCRALWIRVMATSLNWRPGLACFSANCREAIGVVDLFYRPEILPGARDVHDMFDIAIRPQGNSLEGPRIGDSHLLIKISIWPFVVLPALIYRINIKGNSWLWGTVAYALSSRVWAGDEKDRPRIANLIVGVTQAIVLCVVLALLAVLLQGALPIAWIELLKKTADPWAEQSVPLLKGLNWSSARWWVLASLCLSLTVLLFRAFTTANLKFLRIYAR